MGVINSFGHFLKYIVKCSNPTSPISTKITASGSESESNLMMLSAIIPPAVERTRKDKLFNDFLHFLSSSSVTLRSSEKDLGRRLVSLLQNLFWHIDGHLHVFQQRAQAIPQIFLRFTDYNVPERFKHRKRLTSNLSSDVLQELSLELSTILSYPFWERWEWVTLKPHFDALHISISSYSDYLIRQHLPSYKKDAVTKQKRKMRKLPYYASVQHVKNSQLMVQCSKCSLWRLIFSKYRLTKKQREVLQHLIEDFEYTCGATLKDLHLPEEYDDVDVRDHNCFDTIEKLYYSAKYTYLYILWH